MYCLYCGDCCLRMSPLTNGTTCPKLKQDGTFFFCSDYANRPDQCYRHKFDSQFCPIGMSVLKFKDLSAVSLRIDEGWKISKLITG